MSIYGDNLFLNEGILKDWYKSWKKKKEEERKREEERQKRIKEEEAKSIYEQKCKEEFAQMPEADKNIVKQYREKKANEFDKLVKSECSKLMKDPAFVAKIRSDLDKAFKSGWIEADDPDYKQYLNKIPKPDISRDYEGYWCILEDDQTIRVICFRIVGELAKRLEKITGYKISTGDGDEGCIYPDAFHEDLYYYWRHYYRKENK